MPHACCAAATRTALFVLLTGLLIGTATAQDALLPIDSSAAEPADPLVSAVDTVADSTLAERLREVYTEIDAFNAVRVRVRAGVVTLMGDVPRAEGRDRAEELAYRFAGVLYVVNQLEAGGDVEERVSPAIQQVREWASRFVDYLPILGVALLILVIFGLLARLVVHWDQPFNHFGVDPLLRNLIQQVSGFVIFVVGLVLALEVLDVTALVGAILGAAGVVGLAIGFAFQDIVENYLAGALLSLRRPFELNDMVSVDQHEGRVLRLTARELILMTLEGNHVRIPNAMVFKSVINNYNRNPRRRFDFAVGVASSEDLARAQRIGRAALDAMKGVMEDPAPFARVEALADWTVTVRFYGWVDQREADFLKVRSEAIRMVKAALDAEGVDLPDPTYKVHLYQAPALAPPAPDNVRTARAVTEEAAHVDVAPEQQLDAQIAEDLSRPDESNLLKS